MGPLLDQLPRNTPHVSYSDLKKTQKIRIWKWNKKVDNDNLLRPTCGEQPVYCNLIMI